MSDPKKTGSRDISELKQRLGLKKGAAAQTGAAPVARSNGAQSGGVVPPPGLNLPPPPGVAPQQPQLPNAADDPFGAMNAMAAVAQVQRAPEIVVVNDGRPVENVGSGSGSLLKIVVPGVIALIVGVAIGKIGTTAANYNDGIKGTKIVLGDKKAGTGVAGLKATLAEIDTLLDNSKNQKQFRPDPDLDKKLKAAAAKLEVKADQIALARYANSDLAAETLAFYAGVANVKWMIDQHAISAAFDDAALAKAKKGGEDAKIKEDENAMLNGNFRYGIYLPPAPENGGDWGAKLVELGPPYCGKGAEPVAGGRCPDGDFAGFSFRTEPGGGFNKADIASAGDNIPTKKLVLIADGGVRDSLVKSADGVASEAYYAKRLKAIYELVHGKPGRDGQSTVGGLLEDGNKLEGKLSTEASKGTKFSFFM